jgi:hypothetical protein
MMDGVQDSAHVTDIESFSRYRWLLSTAPSCTLAEKQPHTLHATHSTSSTSAGII